MYQHTKTSLFDLCWSCCFATIIFTQGEQYEQRGCLCEPATLDSEPHCQVENMTNAWIYIVLAERTSFLAGRRTISGTTRSEKSVFLCSFDWKPGSGMFCPCSWSRPTPGRRQNSDRRTGGECFQISSYQVEHLWIFEDICKYWPSQVSFSQGEPFWRSKAASGNC